jgi:hypothetical protein
VLSPAALATSGGGLRGGSWTVRGSQLVLRNYTVVSGVTVSGRGNSRLTLRVAGAKAARGTVVLRSGGRLSGTLGGRRISVRFGAPRVSAARASRGLKLAR